ncbi:MAG: hypothetical protein LBV21_04980, partial [Candidatus Adiutrix sp.]|nr:hypothetical protein [Candidatus Adiutrix sp.]
MPPAPDEIDPAQWEMEDRRPPRRVIGGSSAGWLILAAAGLFFLVTGVALWYALAPASLAGLVGRLAGRPLVIEALTLIVDRRPLEIPPGGALVVNPRQKIALGSLITNRWLNYDLSLASPDFDLDAVLGGNAAAPISFLDSSVFRPSVELRLEALDAGRPAAEFKILAQYEARDYAAWVPLTRAPLRRAELYRKILELDPQYPGASENLAAVLVEAGRPDQAAALYEEQVGLLQDEAAAEMLGRLLGLYVDLGRPERQLETLGRLLDLDRRRGRPAAESARLAAGVYRQRGRLDLAGEVLEALLPDVSPGEAAEFLSELALVYRQSGDHQGEIGALKRLAAVVPRDRAREIWS